MAKGFMLALNVSDSAEDGPDVAIVHVTPARLRQWLGEIDRVKLATLAARRDDSRPYGVMYWDDSPYWLKGGGLAEDLSFAVDPDSSGTARLTPDQERRIEAADRHHDAHADAVRRFVTAEQVNWRAYPKHGPGDWNTAHLSRDELVAMLTELDPVLGHYQPTTLALPEGELRVFEPDRGQGDLGRMCVLDVLGVSLLIRQRADGLYVHIDGDATSDRPEGVTTLAVEINNGGDQEVSL